MPIRVTVWGENVHEKTCPAVAKVYPAGMHTAISEALNQDAGIRARTATLDQPEHGLTEAVRPCALRVPVPKHRRQKGSLLSRCWPQDRICRR